ncbi:HAD family hydrolase [Pelagicoccus mobilis]|uniref:HAD family hydrolase n=1 Tax=Pelagicoccus mobilis TaxID=415221 RepID=A0A934RWP2_9BACT|nr:HAD family hydrolase [Pelagicoccus mobilis]MBK1876151.1 HAD family hydrolase [Pelagicoccus mobilis]
MSSNERSPFHPIKAVAIDLDGTLLSPDYSISEGNRAALEELHEAGVEIILASGRHYVSMLPYARSLPQVRYMVSAQGAYASDVDDTQTIHETHMPTEDAAKAIDFGLEHGLSIVVYTASGIHTLSTGKWIDYYNDLAGLESTRSTKEEVLSQPVFKVSYFESVERLDEIQEHPFLKNSHLYTVRSLPNIFEQADPTTSKASGLAPLMAKLGIKPEELATFGDANNDIPMFEYSGFSTAMDRANPNVKAAATLSSPDGPPETSFARAIEAMKAHFSS